MTPRHDGLQPVEHRSASSEPSVGDRLERWLKGDQPKTLGSLIELFGEGSFAILFALLMALPALPLPTGGATHVLEIIVMLLALELIAGRRAVWLPARWRRMEFATPARQRLLDRMLRLVRRLERLSRPRGRWLLHGYPSRALFGLAVLAFALTAFLAPPFSGLDTVPALGAVVLSLGVLMEDAVLAGAGLVLGALGVVVVIGLGSLVNRAVRGLF